jgi:lipoprotein signal peptidase
MRGNASPLRVLHVIGTVLRIVTGITLREHRRQLYIMASVAVAVLLFDLVSKEFATVLLAQPHALTPPALGFSFFLTTNEGAAGGIWLGDHTRFINIASMTLVVLLIALVTRQVFAEHPRASVAFGLIIGAALGNTLSLLMSPGVTDFISLNTGVFSIAFNVADIALVGGVGMLAPIGVSMAARVRSTRRTSIVLDDAPATMRAETARRAPVFEREVPLAFASEVAKPVAADVVAPTKKRVIVDQPVARQDEASL